MHLSRALPSNSGEQPSCVGLLELAARSVLVSPAHQRADAQLVSVAVTKDYSLTAVNRCGALCCPDFPLRTHARSDKPTCFRVYANCDCKGNNFFGQMQIFLQFSSIEAMDFAIFV